jgi:gamma-glutamylcyclotransferase (GGCT)/AIG2-like uncharacterized protein YtfP
LSPRRGVRLFVYGTLLDPARVAAVVGAPARLCAPRPAVLRGMRRVALRGTPYPTLIRDRRGVVAGGVLSVGPRALQRLAMYEGRPYRLRPVAPRVFGRVVRARAWIAPPGRAEAARPWISDAAAVAGARSPGGQAASRWRAVQA